MLFLFDDAKVRIFFRFYQKYFPRRFIICRSKQYGFTIFTNKIVPYKNNVSSPSEKEIKMGPHLTKQIRKNNHYRVSKFE